MDNRIEFKEDPLRAYANHDSIEKAPEGFTSKVMTSIQLEGLSVKSNGKILNTNIVPLISLVVTLLFIVVAILIPEGDTNQYAIPTIKLIKNIKISLPDFNLIPVLNINLPATLLYIFTGIVILAIFDRVLYRVFNGEKQA